MTKTIDEVRKTLQKMRYGIVGNHSAVQVCRWTKSSIKGEGDCWKEKIYGISSAGCCQMTPAVMFCENFCVHCWRPIEMNLGTKLDKIDDPIKILDRIINERKRLLIGMKGIKDLDKKKFDDALIPKLYTMSLSGEPTIYPRLGEMFKEIRKRGAVSFLVTNGLNPEALNNLTKNGGEFPTQITVSTNAPNEELFKTWHRSTKKDAWKVFNKTLDIIASLRGVVRRAIRLTLVNGSDKGVFSDLTNMSDENIKEYASLICKAIPDFVHVKGYKSVGYARKRMDYDKQPWHKEIKVFSKKLEALLPDYKIKAEYERSCLVMLAHKDSIVKIDKI